MDWARWAPAVITLIGWVFTMGLTVGRINNQEIALAEHDDRLEEHEQDIQSHTLALAKMDSRKEGYAEGYREGFKLHRQAEGRG
jgi:flagellar biosynthesis/type III secretory pathway protein FliH